MFLLCLCGHSGIVVTLDCNMAKQLVTRVFKKCRNPGREWYFSLEVAFSTFPPIVIPWKRWLILLHKFFKKLCHCTTFVPIDICLYANTFSPCVLAALYVLFIERVLYTSNTTLILLLSWGSYHSDSQKIWFGAELSYNGFWVLLQVLNWNL